MSKHVSVPNRFLGRLKPGDRAEEVEEIEIVAGTGVTLTLDADSGTLTIDASGGTFGFSEILKIQIFTGNSYGNCCLVYIGYSVWKSVSATYCHSVYTCILYWLISAIHNE